MSRCVMDDYLGAYLLHALEQDEHESMRAHLAECERCRAEADVLADAVGSLALLGTDDVLDALALGQSVTPASRGRKRRVLAAGLVAAGVTAAVAGTLLSEAPWAAAPAAEVVHASDRATHVMATLTVARLARATALHLSLRGVYTAGACTLIVHGRDGRIERAATWRPGAHGRADVDATTGIAIGDLGEFDVVTSSGKQLVRLVMPASGN